MNKYHEKLMGFDSLEYNFEMICVIILTMGIDKHIIAEGYEEHVLVILEPHSSSSL